MISWFFKSNFKILTAPAISTTPPLQKYQRKPIELTDNPAGMPSLSWTCPQLKKKWSLPYYKSGKTKLKSKCEYLYAGNVAHEPSLIGSHYVEDHYYYILCNITNTLHYIMWRTITTHQTLISLPSIWILVNMMLQYFMMKLHNWSKWIS